MWFICIQLHARELASVAVVLVKYKASDGDG